MGRMSCLFFSRFWVCCLGMAWLVWPGASAWAAAPLRCEVTYAGATQVVQAFAVQDPYTVPAVDIRGRFRFKAVVVGTPTEVERIHLYVYQQTAAQPVLVQHAKYLPPFGRSAVGGAVPLTGQQHVYAGPMERELIYSCTLEGGAS